MKKSTFIYLSIVMIIQFILMTIYLTQANVAGICYCGFLQLFIFLLLQNSKPIEEED